ncbi:putative ribonuclease H-like domain-containing protein [Tanacetum coccineum]
MESDISSGDETLTDSTYENFKREKAYKAVPPPTGTIIPPWANVSFTGIDELAIRNKVINQEKTQSSQSAIDRNKVIIEDWVDSDDEETVFLESQKETAFNQRLAKSSFENRSRVPQAVLSRSTDGSYYPRMDNRRPRISSYSPSSRSSTTRTPHRHKRPKIVFKLIWVKKGSTVGSQAVLPQTVKKSAMISPKQTWKPKGNYLDSGNSQRRILNDYAISESGCSGSMTGDKDKLLILRVQSYAIGRALFYLLIVSQSVIRSTIAPRKYDVYAWILKNIIPSGGITCLVAKATEDEAVLWHRRLGHVNFKNINKLVKGNLVRGLPSKTFKLDHFVVESINKKKYCSLVVTDGLHKFSWVFFLAYKDETYDMLHDLIVGLENRLRHKVKTIRCDHGTEFKNQLMNEFCAKKGIKREYSIARTPQQNGVAERKKE